MIQTILKCNQIFFSKLINRIYTIRIKFGGEIYTISIPHFKRTIRTKAGKFKTCLNKKK